MIQPAVADGRTSPSALNAEGEAVVATESAHCSPELANAGIIEVDDIAERENKISVSSEQNEFPADGIINTTDTTSASPLTSSTPARETAPSADEPPTTTSASPPAAGPSAPPPQAPPTAAIADLKIDSAVFGNRLDRLMAAWEGAYQRPRTSFYRLDAIALLSGRQDDDTVQPKTSTFHLWLFGFEFPETLLFFTKDKKYFFFSGPKKLKILKTLQRPGAVFLEKLGGEDTITTALAQMHKALMEMGVAKPKLGRIKSADDGPRGAFATAVDRGLTSWGLDEVKIDGAVSRIISKHDAKAQMFLQKAGLVSTLIARDILVNRIEVILDGELQETHEELSKRGDSVLEDEKKIRDWKIRYHLNPEVIELSYSLVQSGEDFDLRPGAPLSTKNFHLGSGCIIVGVAAKYYDYNANVVRTLLLDATDEQKNVYQLTLDTLTFLLKNLRIGKSLKSLYEAARALVEKRRPDLIDKMTKSLGHATGLDFMEPLWVINRRNENSVEAGMAFNVSVGFSNVNSVHGDPTSPKFAVWLADTAIVKKDGATICVTEAIRKSLESIFYRFKEDEPKSAAEGSNGTAQGSAADVALKRSTDSGSGAHGEVSMSTRLRSRRKCATNDISEQLLTKQMILRKKKLKEIELRVTEGEAFTSNAKRHIRMMTSLRAYKDTSEFPRELKANKIFLDPIREALLVPIEGLHVPFHTSTIRNLVCSTEGRQHALRVNLQVPGSTTLSTKGEENPLPELTSASGLYVKELIFRSTDDNYTALVRQFKEIQKKTKGRDAGEQRDLATVEPLKLNRAGRRVVLSNLMLRSMGVYTRRVVGTLEAHLNGLRFQATRMETVDINYANIKNAFFQSCEREIAVIIHLNLRNPTVVNKKKTSDVQFFTEMGSQTDDLDQRRSRSSFDPDEIAAEQREIDVKRKTNALFKRFVEGVQEMSRIEFEIPLRELGFKGVPKNSQIDLMPTANCLVNLSEWPPFLLALDDVELVVFERVSHGLRSFDVVFIYKDYSKHVRQISNVSVESLDTIKKWLNEIEMVWYEVKSNLNWDAILKTICGDLADFVSSGGFEGFLGDEEDPTKGGSGGRGWSHGGSGGGPHSNASSPNALRAVDSDSEDEDEEYKEADSEEEQSGTDEDSDDDEDESAEEEDSESGSAQSLDSEEEEGMSWDDLEQEAIRDDRKRGYEKDEEEGRQRKKARR